jgi:chromosomal replication initiation ATPase DnaA
MKRQLPLNLPHDPAMGREDFLVTEANHAAHALVSRWPDWPAPWMVLHGPPGCGKSHLAAIWQKTAGAARCEPGALDSGRVPELVAAGTVIVELSGDLPQVPDETALFHLVNYTAERRSFLLLTARAPASAWRVNLPDLRTRLNAMPSAAIAPPDDALLEAVLAKLFRDRQLAVPPAVLNYLVARMERSLDAVRHLAAALDAASLADRRRITIPLAAEVLAGDSGDS